MKPEKFSKGVVEKQRIMKPGKLKKKSLNNKNSINETRKIFKRSH
jgi:hypothetical protein